MKLFLLSFFAGFLGLATSNAKPIDVIDTAGSACADYIRDTWSIAGDRLVIDENRIYTCTDACTDPRLRGIDVTEGLTAKLKLKKNQFAQNIKAKCKAAPQSGKTWPSRCQASDLAIFKVMIPFTGEPAGICFCDNISGSPEMALCRQVDNQLRMVAVFADEPLKRTLDSACRVTSMEGAGVACTCAQQNPSNRRDYVRCLRDKALPPDSPKKSDGDNAAAIR